MEIKNSENSQEAKGFFAKKKKVKYVDSENKNQIII